MAAFTAIPAVMAEQVGLATEYHAWMYLATLCGAIPGVAILVRRRREVDDPRPLLALTVVLTVLGLIVALGSVSLTLLGVGLVLFFAGFTALETILPALVSIFAPCLCGVPPWGFSPAPSFWACSPVVCSGVAHCSWVGHSAWLRCCWV